MKRFILILLLASSSALANPKINLEIETSAPKKDLGHFQYVLYNNEKSYWAEDNSYATDRIKVSPGINRFTIQDLEPGFYALTIFQDANDNGELDKNFLGYPKELFGISNISRKLWSKPKWEEVRFEVTPTGPNRLSITLKYQ